MYLLAGVYSVGGHDASRASVLIPYFTSAKSNTATYVQNVRGGVISEFLAVGYGLETVVSLNLPLSARDVGDTALLAYYRPGFDVRVGDWAEIVSELFAADLEREAPFFALEIAELTSGMEALKSAVTRASLSLPAGKVRDTWLTVERKVTVSSTLDIFMSRAPRDSLREAMDLGDWPLRWKAKWAATKFGEELAELGIEYIGRYTVSPRLRGVVLGNLLSARAFRSRRGGFSERVPDLTNAWLLETANSLLADGHDQAQWASNFRRATTWNFPIASAVVNRAADWVKTFDLAQRQSSPVWARLWSDLWRLNVEREPLIWRAREAKSLYASNSRTIRHLVTGASAQPFDARAVNFIGDWLRDPASFGDKWVDVFLSSLHDLDGQGLYETGMQFLRFYGRSVSRWPFVYNALIQKYGEINDQKDILRQWLLEARSDLPSWPKTLEGYIAKYALDDELAQRTGLWTEAYPEAKYSWKFRKYLLEYHEMGLPKSSRLFE